MAKTRKLMTVEYSCEVSKWDRYVLVQREHSTKNEDQEITDLMWIGGDGAVARSVTGSFEGRLINHGNGIRIGLPGWDKELELDYSQAHALMLLLRAENPDVKSIEIEKLKKEKK